MKTGRTFLAGVVTVLASVVIFVTLLAHYANVLANSSTFATRAVSVVHSGAVESLIVDTITSRVLGGIGDVPSAQPVVSAAVRTALADPRITAEIRAAASGLQSQLASGNAGALSLTLPGIGSAVGSQIESVSPQLAAVVSRVGSVTVVDVRIPPGPAAAINDLATVGRDATLLIALSAALVALALILAVDRRRTLRGLGLGAVAAGLLAVAVYLGGRELVVSQFSASAARTAAHAAWSVYLGGMETAGLVLAAVGAMVVAVTSLRGAA